MKLIRRNKTDKDCAIVAAFNAASWSHRYKPYGEIEKLAKSCGYSKKVGLYPFQFHNLLKKLKVPAKRVTPKSLEDMESRVYLGKMLIFCFNASGMNSAHAMVIILDSSGEIMVVNPQKEWLTWDELAAEINANGAHQFYVYELPHRGLIKQ